MKNKMKTKKSLLKRIKVTATGKWIYKRAFTSHLALSKSQKQKRKLRKAAIMDKTNQTQLKRGLPYAKKTKKNLANCSKPNIVHNRGRKIFVAKNVQESKPSNESKSKE